MADDSDSDAEDVSELDWREQDLDSAAVFSRLNRLPAEERAAVRRYGSLFLSLFFSLAHRDDDPGWTLTATE